MIFHNLCFTFIVEVISPLILVSFDGRPSVDHVNATFDLHLLLAFLQRLDEELFIISANQACLKPHRAPSDKHRRSETEHVKRAHLPWTPKGSWFTLALTLFNHQETLRFNVRKQDGLNSIYEREQDKNYYRPVRHSLRLRDCSGRKRRTGNDGKEKHWWLQKRLFKPLTDIWFEQSC